MAEGDVLATQSHDVKKLRFFAPEVLAFGLQWE